jgi:glycosyltransferase involved in cell wall biosynthesis
LQRLRWAAPKLLSRAASNVWMACGQDAGRFLFGRAAAAEGGRVTYLRNAVDPGAFRYDRAAGLRLRAALGIGQRKCLGHLGRFTEQKNHLFLLDVFWHMRKAGQEWSLLLAGEGPLLGAAREKADRLGLSGLVAFAGASEPPGALYSAMDAFALPSLYEGFPVTLVEAQYAGLPVFCSDACPREADVTGRLCYLPLSAGAAAWAGAILNAQDPERRDGAAAMDAAGYNIHQEAGKLDALYRKALGLPAPAGGGAAAGAKEEG